MKSIGRGIHIVIIAICAVVFLVCVGLLVNILVGYSKAGKTYESINEHFETLGDITPENGETDGSEAKGVTVKAEMNEDMRRQYAYLMELKSTYPDVVGYISIPSVSINYPVVQTTDNDYYLDHLITGEQSSTGSIFLDYRCDANAATAKNTVLYGHNMNNRSMFHNIELLFTRESFLDATVEYITEEGIFIYNPLSIYRTGAYDTFDRYQFVDEDDYLKYCDSVAAKSRFEESAAVPCAADSGIITFVTCTNSISDKNARYIYQAVLDRIYLPEN